MLIEDLKDKLSDVIEYWGEETTDEDVMDFSEYTLKDYLETEKSFKLYKYMPMEYWSIRNIEKQNVHLSNNGILNDIYEGIPMLKKNISQEKIKQLDDLAKITCFTETNDNELMWSHYADGHKGACVEYDLKLLNSEHSKILKHLFPIIYSEKRIWFRNIDSLIESHMRLKDAIANSYEYDGEENLDDILPMFLTKSNVWDYEHEWRIIYSKKQMYDYDNKELYSCNLNFPCISGIYLGYRINSEYKNNIIEICKRMKKDGNDVELYQEKLNEHSYKIEFEKIDFNILF
jgi:hypothetical protein